LLTPGAVRTWYNTCIYFQDVKDFLFCAIVVIITNYAAAEKKTTVSKNGMFFPQAQDNHIRMKEAIQ
jgi:hypothetical protein